MIIGTIKGKIKIVNKDSFLFEEIVKEAQKQAMKLINKLTIIVKEIKFCNKLNSILKIIAAKGIKIIRGKQ